MSKVRVLWVAKGLGPGGMERLLETHARVGDRDHFDFEAAYLVDRPDSIVGSLESLGVRCHRLDGTSNLRWPRQLRTLIEQNGIDVVHVHSPMVAAIARPAIRAMRKRPRLLYTEHNSWDCYGPVTRLANAMTYRLDDEQFAVSRAAATAAPRWLRPTMRPLVHGVDPSRLTDGLTDRESTRSALGIENEDRVVLTVAHLRAEKGYDVLLDAAADVVRSAPDTVFLSVGHGPLLDELERRRDRLGLGDRFRFLGFRSDVPSLMGAADLLCFASRNEGLPVAFMEATTLGLPTVATAVGGLPDVINDGVNGLLVPPADPRALAQALIGLLGDQAARDRMSSASIAAAGRFDARHAVAELETAYSTGAH